MTDDFMADKFWDEICHTRGAGPTLRQAWDKATKRLAAHLEDRGLRTKAEAPEAARGWLEGAVEGMRQYNPGIEKSRCVEQMVSTYNDSADIEWTMALHGLLQVSVKQGRVNPERKQPKP